MWEGGPSREDTQAEHDQDNDNDDEDDGDEEGEQQPDDDDGFGDDFDDFAEGEEDGDFGNFDAADEATPQAVQEESLPTPQAPVSDALAGLVSSLYEIRRIPWQFRHPEYLPLTICSPTATTRPQRPLPRRIRRRPRTLPLRHLPHTSRH